PERACGLGVPRELGPSHRPNGSRSPAAAGSADRLLVAVTGPRGGNSGRNTNALQPAGSRLLRSGRDRGAARQAARHTSVVCGPATRGQGSRTLNVMQIGAMNHPGRPLEAELRWMADLKLDFIDLTLEPPCVSIRQ